MLFLSFLNSSSFFANKDCRYYPCHECDEDINCLFCYCPLYTLGEQCKGNFVYTQSGVKSCEHCAFPHRRENYEAILRRFPELAVLAAKREKAP